MYLNNNSFKIKKKLLIIIIIFNILYVNSTILAKDIYIQNKIAMCTGCHGISNYRIAYPEVYRIPKISGQTAAYLSNALHEYKVGKRKSEIMHIISISLSDKDIEDIACYYSKQTYKKK